MDTYRDTGFKVIVTFLLKHRLASSGVLARLFYLVVAHHWHFCFVVVVFLGGGGASFYPVHA